MPRHAIHGKAFCYFHLHNRRRKPARQARTITADYGLVVPVNTPPAQITLDVELPLLEDRHAIQIGITQIVRALTANEINAKRAGLLLYALQIASANLRDESYISPRDLGNVVLTSDGDQIAPARTIIKEEDLSGHKKSCRCADCVYVQTDNEAHHPDCACGNCESSVAGETQDAEDIDKETSTAETHIPSEAEGGPAVRIVQHEKGWESANLNQLEFVIPSEAEGPAVRIVQHEQGCPILSGAKGGKART